jgi:hypothetical protein
MKAIQVKYIPATNTKGSRWKAIAEGVKPVTVPLQYGDRDAGAYHAAWCLCEKYGWRGDTLTVGTLPNGDWVFCFPMSIVTSQSKIAA